MEFTRFPIKNQADHCAFVLCLKGIIRIQTDLTTEQLTVNRIIPIKESDIIVPSSANAQYRCFILSKNILNGMPVHLLPIYTHMIDHAQVNVKPEQVEQLLALNDLLNKKRLADPNLYNDEIIRNIELAMLNEIYLIYHATHSTISKNQQRKKLVNDFFELVMKYHRKERHTAFYADKLCLTPKYLSLLIKRYTSKTVNQWINDTLIAEIKLMLKSSDMTAQQIADYLNFPNSSFFGRFFKQHTGLTTKEYRLSA